MFKLTLSLFFILYSLPSTAEETKFTGDLKAHIISGQHGTLTGAALSQQSLVGSSRLKVFKKLNDSHNIEFAYKISSQLSQSDHQTPLSSSISYRIADIEEVPLSLQDSEIHTIQNLDRWMWNYSGDLYDFFIGRQAVSFGSGRSVNPTDIFLPYAPALIDVEHRIGIDAIRVQKSTGEMGEFDFGIVFGEKAHTDKGAAFANVKLPLEDWDLSLTGIYYRKHQLLGIDLQGSLFDQGVWLEWAFNSMKNSVTTTPTQDFHRLVTGFDYRLNDESILFLEYHHNGVGQAKRENYSSLQGHPAYTESGVFFLGKDYLIPGFALQVSPLISYSASFMLNLNDQSQFTTHRFEWNYAEDSYLDLNFMTSLGATGSEFKNYPTKGTLSYRTYF